MKRLTIFLSLLIVLVGVSSAQNVEELLDFRKRKPLQLSGSLSAQATHLESDPKQARKAFSYQIQGAIKLSLFELIDIPISLNLNNYGTSFSYPAMPNRFRMTPRYKWVKAYIGDVSMTFSPYTLNGHQFTGLGVELSPGGWQLSAMVGRLLRRVEPDSLHPQLRPSYSRWGYGAKVRYKAEKFSLGASLFSARDSREKIMFEADLLGIKPKGNLAVEVEGSLSLFRSLSLEVIQAFSLLQRDLRSRERSLFFATKLGLSYALGEHSLGLGYERISPDYETLGAYYFNNDYENITLNYSGSFFDKKLGVNSSGGLQRDDLSGDKAERNLRLVGAVGLSYTPSERLSVRLNLSSYQAFRNLKSSFDYINERSPYDNLDTLRFTQINNSLDFSLDWALEALDVRKQSLSLGINYQEGADKQGVYIMPGNLNRLINAAAGYTLDFPLLDLSLGLNLNASHSYAARRNTLILGPDLMCSKRFFDKALLLMLTLSYNRTLEERQLLASIYNIRYRTSYTFLKRHSLDLSLAYQRQRLFNTPRGGGFSLLSQLNYSYSF